MANRIFFTHRNQGTQADARRRENYKVVCGTTKCETTLNVKTVKCEKPNNR